METYRVRVTKDYLVFCAAHFISYEKSKCERLHGHNYRITAEVTGPLDENYLVLDFIELKKILRRIADRLDHRVLLPERNPVITVERQDREVVVRHRDQKRWVFPEEDCAVLPIENTTAELLAAWIAARLSEELRSQGFRGFSRLRIEVEEAPGQAAQYEIDLSEKAG